MNHHRHVRSTTRFFFSSSERTKLCFFHTTTTTPINNNNGSSNNNNSDQKTPNNPMHQNRSPLFQSKSSTATPSSSSPYLYNTHIPTSFIQKGLIGIGSSLMAFMNPLRADMVAALGETTGELSLRYMQVKMRESESGRRILEERPRFTMDQKLNNEYLKLLPSDTLGGGYYKYMSSHGFKAEERPVVRFVDDEQLAYIMMRYRETHDFFHVLADLPPTVLGELAIKALEFVQLRLPMNALSSFAVLRLPSEERRIYFNELLPWAWRCGVNSKFILGYEYEKNLNEPLENVRRELLFEKAPIIKEH